MARGEEGPGADPEEALIADLEDSVMVSRRAMRSGGRASIEGELYWKSSQGK